MLCIQPFGVNRIIAISIRLPVAPPGVPGGSHCNSATIRRTDCRPCFLRQHVNGDVVITINVNIAVVRHGAGVVGNIQAIVCRRRTVSQLP
ncbi:hypothetical protein D3C75_618830 [compost metagenome]